MKATVNGIDRELADGMSVHDLLVELAAARDGVAVAVDGELVPRTRWVRTPVPDGAVVEVLTAVQGG